MNLRKLVTTLIFLLVAMLLSIVGLNAHAFANNGPAVATESVRSHALMKRLEEIKAMDFASMTTPEKKKLRKEVRSITKEVRQIHGRGVYISVAGLIIIALLLILLL